MSHAPRAAESVNPSSSTRKSRNKEQSMGLWLNESLISNPTAMDSAVRDLAENGYGILRIMLRNTNFSHRSPQVLEAVARIVALAHEVGIQVAMDFEPHPEPVVRDLGGNYPEALACRVVRLEGRIVRGRFVLRTPAPGTLGMRADFLGIEAAYLQDGGTIRKLESLKHDYRMVVEPYENGYTTDAHSYTEGRAVNMRTILHLTGHLPGVEEGALIVYARFFDTRLPDFWAEGTWKYFDDLMDCYRDIPLDGISWDEPAVGGEWSHYFSGEAFLKAFRKLNGYDMSECWNLLDDGDLSPAATKVRLDYYRTLNEGVFEAQRRIQAKARQLWGDNLLLGTHHTWQGEGGINDYRAGAVDYFRLNENMDAGYTDCWWWDYKSSCYVYTLGSSLGRLTPSGEAEVNTWDAKPSNSRVEFQSRLMTLLDITWFNIWYGLATDTCLFPADYTWPTTAREMRRHRDGQRLIGAAKPVIHVAILHGWETVCGINRADIASAHKAFCMNFSEVAIGRSLAFDWVDCGLLENSHVEGERLCNALGKYSLLVLPYAAILTAGAWKACQAFAAAGGKVIFTGPPPDQDTAGNSLRESFAELIGMKSLSLDGYLASIASTSTLPPHRADKLDVCVELSGDPGRLLVSVEGEKHGIRNAKGNVIYLTDLDPRLRLADVIESELPSEVICYSDSILWRAYRESKRAVLVCAAREGLSLRGLIRWEGFQIEFFEGKIAILEIKDGRLSITGTEVRHQVSKMDAPDLAVPEQVA